MTVAENRNRGMSNPVNGRVGVSPYAGAPVTVLPAAPAATGRGWTARARARSLARGVSVSRAPPGRRGLPWVRRAPARRWGLGGPRAVGSVTQHQAPSRRHGFCSTPTWQKSSSHAQRTARASGWASGAARGQKEAAMSNWADLRGGRVAPRAAARHTTLIKLWGCHRWGFHPRGGCRRSRQLP